MDNKPNILFSKKLTLTTETNVNDVTPIAKVPKKIFSKNLHIYANMMVNRKSQIKSILKEVLYNSTAQAILKIFNTRHKLIKIIWIICLVLTCSTCAPLIVKSLTRYFSYEVVTTSRTIYEAPALFPKITICNRNLFTTEYSAHFLERYGYLDTVYKMNNVFDESEKKRFTHPLSEILLACTFNDQNCTADDFSNEFYKDGNCSSFNTGFNSSGHEIPLRESIRVGSNYGLKLTLYVNYYENLTKFNKYYGASIKIGNVYAANCYFRV